MRTTDTARIIRKGISQIHLIVIIVDVTLILVWTAETLPVIISTLCLLPEYPYYVTDYAGIMGASLTRNQNI